MAHHLVLEIPDDVYQPLARKAQATGQSVEAVAQSLLAEVAQTERAGRLRDLAGFWASKAPDAGLRHDEYLGRAQFDELNEPHRD